MKVILEILVAVILHPVAVILMWINLAGRDDLNVLQKIIWAVLAVVPIVPIIYAIVGGGALW
jgi:hypothetical protein